MTFIVPKLSYDYDALGRYISGDIMRLHHDKHHQAYVDKLNAAIATSPEYAAGKSLEELVKNYAQAPESIRTTLRNQGGGHLNHSLFWEWMSPQGGGEPTGILAQEIAQKYGSFQNFTDVFSAKALEIFGSGWVWLDHNLVISLTGLQDNPIMYGAESVPILGLDVWEHAYYLDYKNRRDDYIAAWWHTVDWRKVADLHTNSQK